MSQIEKLTIYLDSCIEKNNKLTQLAQLCEMEIAIFEEAHRYFYNARKLALTNLEIKENYIQQMISDSSNIINSFKFNITSAVPEKQKQVYQELIERDLEVFKTKISVAVFNINIFVKFNFFDKNIVAIGANGSGKSTLSSRFKQYLPNTSVSISAQKVLVIPTLDGISNFNETENSLKTSQVKNFNSKITYKSSKSLYIDELVYEFKLLLNNLIAENNVLTHNYIQSIKSGEKAEVPNSKLDKAMNIWNSLIEHRELICEDGINLFLQEKNTENSYLAYQMSDGEKVVLYYVAHILQAPKNGFVIIDEPEMYLHKTLLNKLWDILEREREDCIFIYLTHDLDFATTRSDAKKVWIKSFSHPDHWEIEDIPENELPKPLLLKLLGSRKNILFCESEKGKIDHKIYNALLPNYTITPVKSCFDVINYTKAFNKLPNVTTKALGLIDSDHHDQEHLATLEKYHVFSLQVSEIENLLFDADFLTLFAKRCLVDENVIPQIKKEVIESLNSNKELQVSNYISAKINNRFKSSHVKKGNTKEQIETNFQKFTQDIDIEEWFASREQELQKIIDDEDYQGALLVSNDKGLKRIANKYFNMGDFQEKAIRYIQTHQETHQVLLKYLPDEVLAND